MRKWIGAILFAAALALASSGAAQEVESYVYGGSSRDWLYHMAVSDNGYIALTGWTESSDGTLQNRTKSGRSGWLLVIDRDGKEIVNFCTRLGNHDNLCYPVFHEDGTLTVLLFAEDVNVGWVKYELLRLDMDAKVLSRKVIAHKGEKDEHFITVIGHDERGYILQERLYGDGGYTRCEIVDYDGNGAGRLDNWYQVTAVADAHVIRAETEEGKEQVLCRVDEQGGETQLCKAYALREDNLRPVMYDGFISLPDGGAAGCGWVLEKDETKEERIGLFTRWDAQGRVISEMRTPGWSYGEMALRPGGFAATANPWDDEGWQNDAVWTLYLLDQNGVMQGTTALTGNAVNTGHNACVGALGDGTIVTAHVTPENGEDTVVTVIKP